MHKDDIDTPALLLDLDVMEANIAAMAAFFRDRPQKLRPHFKTPKTPQVARRQLQAGAVGITCAKLGEAEVLADAGLSPEIVSAGGTGTFDVTGCWPDVTEVQAGSYVFMDGKYRTVRPDLGQPALTLLTTVIARRGPFAIIDAGLKALTNEFGPPTGKDLPLKVAYLSEEHGHVVLRAEPSAPGSGREPQDEVLEGVDLTPGDRI